MNITMKSFGIKIMNGVKSTNMTWNKITLGQFQDIYRLSQDKELDEMERISRVISIIYGLSEAQVEDLTIPKFNELAKSCAFVMNGEIPGKPVRSFRIGTKKFAINYKPQSLKHRQYVEILHFSEKPIDNMHYIMASLVNPVRFGFKLKNKADEHSKLSEAMLDAPFLAVYHSCIFFCKLYSNSIEAIRPYLISEMMSKGMTEMEANRLMTVSISALDGFITLKRWPNLKV